MTDAAKNPDFSISVVIPALNAEDYLPLLLKSIEVQTLLPTEIVIVDSSSSNKTADLMEAWKGPIPIVYRKVDFAYPGRARNIGVKLARNEWIAFLDCRTIPREDWLEVHAKVATRSGVEFVGALCMSDADTHFKEVLRAATYGCAPIETVVGSLLRKSVFEQSGGFIPDVRAGEDSEWLYRLESSEVKIIRADFPTIKYCGLVESLPEAIIKWCVNYLAITDIEVKNSQKSLYFLIFLFFIFVLVYNWNSTFAPGNDGGTFYVPNITKIFVAAMLVAYVAYRGVIRPLQADVKLSFLLPLRWLQVSFVGFCLDIAKAPGLILGAIRLLMRRAGR